MPRIFPFVLAGCLVLGAACRERPPATDVVARLGETEVHYAQFERYVEQALGDADAVLASGVLTRLFDRFLEEEMLTRLAVERGLAGPGVPRRQAVDALLDHGLAEEPAETELASYYHSHRASFARPERVLLRQILVEDRETAERALAEVAAGADFAAVARRVSRDPSAGFGGVQGEVSRDDVPPAFVDTIFGLRPGEVSPAVAADYGYHVFQVVERYPAEVVPLPQARDEIVKRLREERADRLLTGLIEEARDRYNVVVYTRNLPFNYEGAYSESKK